MAQAITAPGDVILAPNPTYPIHEFGFIIAGGVLRHLPVEPNSRLFGACGPGHEAFDSQAHCAWCLSYPSNPTAIMADLDFYTEVVAYARKNDLIILSDVAYSEIYFEDNPPPSVLQVPGAMDVAVEFTSLSKTYAMPGWRMGFAVGNERLIAALARVKSYLDYGAFTPIQVAAAAALNGPDKCVEDIRQIYKTRRDCLVSCFARSGWDIPSPPATMFAWAPIPEKFKSLGSLEFSKVLLEKADIAVSPGVGFGEFGEGYVRFGLVENEHRIRQAARSLRKFLAEADETMHNVIPING